MRLSAVEKKVLNAVQDIIPFEQRPFEALACKIGITEKELIEKIRGLREKKIIRDYSARINHKELGFKSTLFGFRVPPEKIMAVVNEIVPFKEATHCFQREGVYNIWVAFVYRDGKDKELLRNITKVIGKDKENVLNLKTVKKFKLKTRLEI